jgi:hypothetical protein
MITMNDNSAQVDYESETESAKLVTDDSQITDFTQVACCAFTGEPEVEGDRQSRVALISDNLAMEDDDKFSLKLYLSRMLGLK